MMDLLRCYYSSKWNSCEKVSMVVVSILSMNPHNDALRTSKQHRVGNVSDPKLVIPSHCAEFKSDFPRR
jgi:hypothetical protein